MNYEPPLSMAASVCPDSASVPVPSDLPDDPAVACEMWRWMWILIEVIDGRRAARQLAPFAGLPVVRYLQATASRVSGPQAGCRAPALGWRRARVESVRVCQPTDRVAEVAAVCLLRGRVRAVAARFERRGTGGWFCDVVRIG